MNYIYTKQQILNMKKASTSAKKSKGYSLEEFLKLSRKWMEEEKEKTKKKKVYANIKKV